MNPICRTQFVEMRFECTVTFYRLSDLTPWKLELADSSFS